MSRTATGAGLALTVAFAAVGLGIGPTALGGGRLAEASLLPTTNAEVRHTDAVQTDIGRERRNLLQLISDVRPEAQPPTAPTAQRSVTVTGGGLGRFVVTCYALTGRTASGRGTSTDVVAVDPRVIPLGRRIWIQGVGVRTAADTGGAIKGHRLDIWMPSVATCRTFGVQSLNVTYA